MTGPNNTVTLINRPLACRLETPALVTAQISIIDPYSIIGLSPVSVDINSDVIAEGVDRGGTVSSLVDYLLTTDARHNEKSPTRGKKLIQAVGFSLVQQCHFLDVNGSAHGPERLASLVIGHKDASVVPVMEVERSHTSVDSGVATIRPPKELTIRGHLMGLFAQRNLVFGILPATEHEEDGTEASIQSVLQVGLSDDDTPTQTRYIALHTNVPGSERRYSEDVKRNFAVTLGSILRYSV